MENGRQVRNIHHQGCNLGTQVESPVPACRHSWPLLASRQRDLGASLLAQPGHFSAQALGTELPPALHRSYSFLLKPLPVFQHLSRSSQRWRSQKQLSSKLTCSLSLFNTPSAPWNGKSPLEKTSKSLHQAKTLPFPESVSSSSVLHLLSLVNFPVLGWLCFKSPPRGPHPAHPHLSRIWGNKKQKSV